MKDLDSLCNENFDYIVSCKNCKYNEEYKAGKTIRICKKLTKHIPKYFGNEVFKIIDEDWFCPYFEKKEQNVKN